MSPTLFKRRVGSFTSHRLVGTSVVRRQYHVTWETEQQQKRTTIAKRFKILNILWNNFWFLVEVKGEVLSHWSFERSKKEDKQLRSDKRESGILCDVPNKGPLIFYRMGAGAGGIWRGGGGGACKNKDSWGGIAEKNRKREKGGRAKFWDKEVEWNFQIDEKFSRFIHKKWTSIICLNRSKVTIKLLKKNSYIKKLSINNSASMVKGF